MEFEPDVWSNASCHMDTGLLESCWAWQHRRRLAFAWLTAGTSFASSRQHGGLRPSVHFTHTSMQAECLLESLRVLIVNTVWQHGVLQASMHLAHGSKQAECLLGSLWGAGCECCTAACNSHMVECRLSVSLDLCWSLMAARNASHKHASNA
eukprot:1160423-Pelagomonas_calceolata.AAC.1